MKESIRIPFYISIQLPTVIKNELSKLTPENQKEFIDEFKRKMKSIPLSYIFWILFGSHYIYLGKWLTQIIFWLTIGGLLIWWLIDIFRIPLMVIDLNKDIAIEVFKELRTIKTQ